MAKKLSITPLHDRVIVKPAAAEEKSAGGIIIPDTAKEILLFRIQQKKNHSVVPYWQQAPVKKMNQ